MSVCEEIVSAVACTRVVSVIGIDTPNEPSAALVVFENVVFEPWRRICTGTPARAGTTWPLTSAFFLPPFTFAGAESCTATV